MNCPSCGQENPDGSQFRLGCGGGMSLSCSNCGNSLPLNSRFCNACRTPVTSPTGPASASPTPASQPSRSQPTSFADGRYEVQRFLGEGGKKKVYLAHDSLLDRDVAFALIKTEGLDEAGRTRISREAQAMGRLGSHPHIVTVFDLGLEEGQPYMVSELMGGVTWRAL